MADTTQFRSIVRHSWFPILVLLLIPLTVNDMQNGWVKFENALLQYGALTILFVALLLPAFRFSGNHHIKISYLGAVFILFSVYILLNTPADLLTIWNERTMRTAFLLTMFLLLQPLFRNGEMRDTFWIILMVPGIVNCIFGFIQYFDNFHLPDATHAIKGTFNNASLFSCYVAATLPASFYTLTKQGDKWFFKTGILTYIIASGLLLLMTLSRAAIIGSIAGVIYFIGKRYGFGKKYILLIIPIAIIVFSALLYFVRSDSATGRLLIWKVSLRMWLQHPVTGIGSGHFSCSYNDYQADFFQSHQEPLLEMLAGNTYYAFNEYLETLVENGLPGLLLLLLLTVVIFWKIQSSPPADTSLLCAQTVILTILVFGLFSYPFSSMAISSILVACLAFLSCHSKVLVNFRVNPKLGNMLIAAFLIGLVSLGTAGAKRYLAIVEWKKASELILYENIPDALQIYTEIYPALEGHGAFLYNYGAELSEMGRYDESIVTLEKASKIFSHIDLYIFLGKSYEGLADFKNAEKNYLHAARMIPHRFIPKYLLVKLYTLHGDQVKAISLAKEIVEMPVKVDSRIVSQIKKEMKLLVENESSRL